MISVNRLNRRKADFRAGDWIMDSGAFTAILLHGDHRMTSADYAARIRRWQHCGNLLAAVAQDYMCEPEMLRLTGGTVAEHQALTIVKYDELQACAPPCHVMPVLQGYDVADYLRHLESYGDRLGDGHWVGVGSVCKRNTDISQIEDILGAIKVARPDLRLHGFGVKQTALMSAYVRNLLWSADSMAWSFAARKQGRNGNSWREARSWLQRLNAAPSQHSMFERFHEAGG